MKLTFLKGLALLTMSLVSMEVFADVNSRISGAPGTFISTLVG